MAYVQLDDRIRSHPKILRAGPEAAWMWAAGLSYCNDQLTDGFVPVEALSVLGRFRQPKRVAEWLVTVGLFDPVEGGYQIHDYFDYNPSRKVVLERKRQAAHRKERWKERHHRSGAGTSTERGPERVLDTVPNALPSRTSRARVSDSDSDSPPDPCLDLSQQVPAPSQGGGGRPPPPGTRSGPLITRRKGWCAWEGAALSVHSRLHEDLRGRLEHAGLDRATADRELFTWYSATEDAWRGQEIGEDLFEFWRKRFREWRGTTPSKSEDEIARERRRAKLQAEIASQEARR